MNSFLGIIFLTFLIYSLLYERTFAIIYGSVLFVYLFLRLFLKDSRAFPFNSIYQNTLEAPRKADCYLTMVADVTEAMRLMKEHNEKIDKSGIRLTVTHLATKAMSQTLGKFPHCGTGRIAFGRYIPRDSIDVSILVDMETENGRDLGFFKLKQAHERSICEISEMTRGKSTKLRTGKDKNFKESQQAFKIIPSFVGQWACQISGWLFSSLALNIKKGFKESFGTLMITSIGMMGSLKFAYPCQNFSRVSAILCVGKIEQEAVYRNKEIQIRSMLYTAIQIDVRHIPLCYMSQFCNEYIRILENPHEILS